MVFNYILYFLVFCFVFAEEMENGAIHESTSKVTFTPEIGTLTPDSAEIKKALDVDTRTIYALPKEAYTAESLCPISYYPEILSNLLDVLIEVLNYSSDTKKVGDALIFLKKNLEISPPTLEKSLLGIKMNLIEAKLLQIKKKHNGIDTNGAAKTMVIFKQDIPGINQPQCREEFGNLLHTAYDAYQGLSKYPNCQINGQHSHGIPTGLSSDKDLRPFEIIYTHAPHVNNLDMSSHNQYNAYIGPSSSTSLNNEYLLPFNLQDQNNNPFNKWSLINQYKNTEIPNKNQPDSQAKLSALLTNPYVIQSLTQNGYNVYPSNLNTNPTQTALFGPATKPSEVDNDVVNYLYEYLSNYESNKSTKPPNIQPQELVDLNTLSSNLNYIQDVPLQHSYTTYPGHIKPSGPYPTPDEVNNNLYHNVFGQYLANLPENKITNGQLIVPADIDTVKPLNLDSTTSVSINPSLKDILNQISINNLNKKDNQPTGEIDYSVLLNQLGLAQPPSQQYIPEFAPYGLNTNLDLQNGKGAPNKLESFSTKGSYFLNPGDNYNSILSNLNIQNADNKNLYGTLPESSILNNYKVPIQYDKVTVNHNVIPYILEYIKSSQNLQNQNKILNNGNYGNLVDGNGASLDLKRPLGISNLFKLPTSKPNKLGLLELTYVLKRPKPLIYHPVYYVKYRVPYSSFVDKYQKLASKPSLRLQPAKFYQELLTSSNITEVSSDLKGYRRDDLLNLVFQNGTLVDAKIINGKDNFLNEQLAIIQNLNSNIRSEDILNLTNVSFNTTTEVTEKPVSIDFDNSKFPPKSVPEDVIIPKQITRNPVLNLITKTPFSPVLPNTYLNPYIARNPNTYPYFIPSVFSNPQFVNPRLLVRKPQFVNPLIYG